MNRITAIRSLALLTALVLIALALPAVPVAAEPVLKEDGWYYADTLPADVTADKYTIQYSSYYYKTATKSPGSGWVKGAVVKTTYKNSGDPYWSYLDLAVTDTRVLADCYYYHYCGEKAQGQANYYANATFTHYDKLKKTSYKPDKGHADSEDPRYKYYILTNSKGKKYYCNHGTTCDTDADIHGKRCYYWYRVGKYQNRTKTVYYNYSKTAGWQAAADKNADRVTVRYKPIAPATTTTTVTTPPATTTTAKR